MNIKLILAIIVYSISAVCITITVKNSKAKKLKSYFVEQIIVMIATIEERIDGKLFIKVFFIISPPF